MVWYPHKKIKAGIKSKVHRLNKYNQNASKPRLKKHIDMNTNLRKKAKKKKKI